MDIVVKEEEVTSDGLQLNKLYENQRMQVTFLCMKKVMKILGAHKTQDGALCVPFSGLEAGVVRCRCYGVAS